MAIAGSYGGTLVDLDAFDDAVNSSGDRLRDYVHQPRADSKFSVPVSDGVTVGAAELVKARAAKSETNPFQGIGSGKPLTFVIETIYVGDYPDTMPWVPRVDRGDVLVTSAHKAFGVFEAAPRALHVLEKRAKRRVSLRARATQQGSQLVYYSPAVTDMSLLFSVELSVDRDLHDEIGDALAKAVTAAGALPVFAPAAPYLVAAGIAIPIGMKAMHLLARPNTFYAEDLELNLNRPGIELAQPGALVLYPAGDDSSFGEQYKLGRNNVIRDVSTGKPYDGELPYVVISLDGTEHAELEKWSATAASGAILERFFSSGELISNALGIVTDSLTLYNDITYQQRAADALQESKTAKGAKKKKLEDEYKAYVKNIQTKAIRDTVDKTT